MIRILYFVILSVLISSFATAQDTSYVDYNYRKVPIENAAFIQIITKTDSGYLTKLTTKAGKQIFVRSYKDEKLKVLEGNAKYYFENGMVDSEGRYKNGKRDGTWRFYHDNGNLCSIIPFANGELAGKPEYFKSNGEIETDINQIEMLPSFKGGNAAIGVYLKSNLKYPEQSRKAKIGGTVKVAFTVSKTGKVIDPQIVSGVNEELNNEAVRVISLMPDWNPGIQYNRPVKVRYVLPIVFAL